MACRRPDRLDNDNDFARSEVNLLGHNSLTFFEIKSIFCGSASSPLSQAHAGADPSPTKLVYKPFSLPNCVNSLETFVGKYGTCVTHVVRFRLLNH